MLAITNERGNLKLITSIDILGSTLGTCVIDEYLVIFTHDSTHDRIYRLSKPSNNNSTTVLLFEGNLNLSERIQALPFYENENIQKVYWIDGINQPRVINVVADYSSYTDTSFDFVQELKLEETVSIEKQTYGGSFKSGVIQYAFTYFNKNGVESNIFYITPIQYISPPDRGGKIDEFVNNSFKIDISNLETKFEYIRIYGVFRTSIDTTPEVRNIIDLKINSTSASFVDTGIEGEAISSDYLLYVGGEELIPKAMTQKNNVLFLGNIDLKKEAITPIKLTEIDTISEGDVSSMFSWN